MNLGISTSEYFDAGYDLLWCNIYLPNAVFITEYGPFNWIIDNCKNRYYVSGYKSIAFECKAEAMQFKLTFG